MEQCLAQEAKIYIFFLRACIECKSFFFFSLFLFFGFFFGIQITLYEAMFSAGRQRNV